MGKLAEAEHIWRASIQIAVEVKGISIILESILGVASILAKDANSKQAYELPLIISNHPASVEKTKVRAAKLRAELETQLTLSQIRRFEVVSEKKRWRWQQLTLSKEPALMQS